MAGLLVSKVADMVTEIVVEVVKKASTKAGEQVAVKEVDKHYSKESAGVPQTQPPPKRHSRYTAAISGFSVIIGLAACAAILRRKRTANVPETVEFTCHLSITGQDGKPRYLAAHRRTADRRGDEKSGYVSVHQNPNKLLELDFLPDDGDTYIIRVKSNLDEDSNQYNRGWYLSARYFYEPDLLIDDKQRKWLRVHLHKRRADACKWAIVEHNGGQVLQLVHYPFTQEASSMFRGWPGIRGWYLTVKNGRDSGCHQRDSESTWVTVQNEIDSAAQATIEQLHVHAGELN